MSSVYANIVNKIRNANSGNELSKPDYTKITDIEETDPYYFVVRDKGTIISEGELPYMKLKLPDEYYNRTIKGIIRDKITMVAYIDF